MTNPSDGRWSQLRQFFAHDAWMDDLSSMSGLRALAVRLLRIGQLVIRGFREDDLAVHAASLTFSTLMSLVPLLTLGFAMLKGFGGGEEASVRLAEAMEGMPRQFRDFVQQMVDLVLKANFKTLGWVGIAVLFVTATQVLGSIEASFNRVWGVASARPLWRKFTNYVSVTVVVPVLIMTAFAVSATLKNQVVATHLAEGSVLGRTALALTPLATVWLALFLLFIFMPNTHVSRRASAFSALLGAALWIGWQRIYVNLQVTLSKYDAIYGTFASVPIFLLWLFVSWMIILLGAEIAFAVQHHQTYHLERTAAQASIRTRLALAIAAVLEAARASAGGRAVLNLSNFAHTRCVPVRLLNDVASLLERGGLLAELADAPGTYALLRAPDQLRVREVVALLLNDGTAPRAAVMDDEVQRAAAQVVAELEGAVADNLGERTFRDLLAATPSATAP